MFACQLAKHAFKAGKVITTLSTSKIPKVKELLGEDTIDQSKSYLPSSPDHTAHIFQLSTTQKKTPKK